MCPIIEIFGLHIQSYALLAILGMLLAAYIFLFHTRLLAKISVKEGVILIMSFLIGAVLGSKLLYIIIEWEDIFSSENGLYLAVFGGGFVFYGGLLGGALLSAICSKLIKIPVYSFFDSFSAPLTLAHAIGRVGCFLAGCCYGCPTNLFIGVVYPEGGIAPSGVKLLPVQLFEAGFLIILAIILLNLKNKRLSTPVYLMSYSCWRFFIEFLRYDDRGSFFNLSPSQAISVLLFAFAILRLMSVKKAHDEGDIIYKI